MRKLRKHIELNSRLKEIGACADTLGVPAYLVGGAVRDLLLGIRDLDWDITVEGDPSAFVQCLAKRYNAKVLSHPRFGTFVLSLPSGLHLDIVTARKETYPRPGHLPVVHFSTLKDDLYRRDFTVNALALGLSGSDRGKLIDHYGGMRDLQQGLLRILHERSFQDDPTRIFRLARFAGRGFVPESRTEHLAVLDKHYLSHLSKERCREELIAILSEKDPYPALTYLEKWSVLGMLFPGLTPGPRLRSRRSLAERFDLLLSGLRGRDRTQFMDELKLPRKLKQEIKSLKKQAVCEPALTGKDLIGLGYEPGPHFKEILRRLASRTFRTRREAVAYVFDKFPKKK